MVTELPPDRFEDTRPLWGPFGIHLAVDSILVGKTPARMFVDDAVKPGAAVTWFGHRLFLAGDFHDVEFGETIKNECVRREKVGRFVAYSEPVALGEAEGLLDGFTTTRGMRRFYSVDPSARRWQVRLPEGYSVEPITEALLGRGLGNTSLVEAEMASERGSVAEFLGKSLGLVATRGGEIACWCTSEYNVSDRCEVGIETAPGHRRKGLARAVVGVLFARAAEAGIRRVGWHCWADNAASVATAEALGIGLVAEYPALMVEAAGSTL